MEISVSTSATCFCTAGHEIPTNRVSLDTEVVSLDKGARVLICIYHGAPICFSFPAPIVEDSGPKEESLRT